MGGNALRQPSCRLDKQELLGLIVKFNNEIAEPFKSTSSGVPAFRPIPFYTSKDSFGDLDMVVMCGSRDWERLLDDLKKKYPDHSKNGNVFSFGVDIGKETPFQIDLIYVGETREESRIALTYFAFNDLGNLMGRIYHRAGFKYGHQGLLRVVRDEENSDHIIGEVLVTNEPREIFEFGGYDYDEFVDGFSTREDIFKYVASSPYFNREIFLFENRNSKARARDSKRVIYNEFLKWCSESDDLPEFQSEDKEEFRREQLQLALEKFPEFRVRYEGVLKKLLKSNTINEKFNGSIVSEVSGLSGRDLGLFIRDFKSKWTDDDLFLLSKGAIAMLIKEAHSERTKNSI